MPGGNWRNMNCDAAVTCALAVSRLTPGLQIDLDYDLAVVGRRLDMLDIVDQRGQRLLVRRRQAALKLFRIQSRIRPANRDHRDIDVRKDVRRRPQNDHAGSKGESEAQER